MNNEMTTDKLMNERISSFIGKLPVQPDGSGVIRIRRDNGTEYVYHTETVMCGERTDTQIVLEPHAGIKHIVCSDLYYAESFEYAATPDGKLFYVKFAPEGSIRFLKRFLRLNVLFVFDPEKREDGERPCFAAEDGSVIYTENTCVVKMRPDGTSETLFDIDTSEGSGRKLTGYLDGDHILVFDEEYRGMISHEAFYYETGELFDGPTRESLMIKAAKALVNAIIDWDQTELYFGKKSVKRSRRVFYEFRDHGFENTGVSYNIILSVINALTQIKAVLPRRRDLLVRTINSFISVGVPADVFPAAVINILDIYRRTVTHIAPSRAIDPEIVSALESLADDAGLDAEQKRETLLDERKFMEYMKKTKNGDPSKI